MSRWMKHQREPDWDLIQQNERLKAENERLLTAMKSHVCGSALAEGHDNGMVLRDEAARKALTQEIEIL